MQKIGFPLKDKSGQIQVTKGGIDRVVKEHFEKVFQQNPVPKGKIWEEYWRTVDKVFNVIANEKWYLYSYQRNLLELYPIRIVRLADISL